MRLEPQGLLYAKLTLSEQQEAPGTAEPHVFGLPLPLLVEREQPPGQVPLIIQKCVEQIERRGLRVRPLPNRPSDLRLPSGHPAYRGHACPHYPIPPGALLAPIPA